MLLEDDTKEVLPMVLTKLSSEFVAVGLVFWLLKNQGPPKTQLILNHHVTPAPLVRILLIGTTSFGYDV